MEYQNILEVIDELEEMLDCNTLDYEMQILNNLICRIEDTYKK